MYDDEFDRIVSDFEVMSKQDPTGYRNHVVRFALLGYAYIFGLIVFLLFGVLLLLGLLFVFHVWILIKFSFLILIAVWMIVKSLWVKYSEPDGIVLHRNDAPKLFDLIDKLTSTTKGVKIDKVLMNDRFNCAISQFPRLGIFGWHKNILILGLPMLQSVSTRQFRSILAHEMGHLSSQHGKLGCWVYHVQLSWAQTYLNLATQTSMGVGLIRNFANWFLPMFEAKSMVLRREHEYAADRISAEVAGPESAAEALIQTALKGEFLQERFWDKYWKSVYYEALPPANPMKSLRKCLDSNIELSRAEEILIADWAKHASDDSHPALSERLKALLPDSDWSQPQLVAIEAAERFYLKETAAEDLFGSALPAAEARLEEHFLNTIRAAWEEKHKFAVISRERMEALEKLLQEGPLSLAEAQEFSALCSGMAEPAEAIDKHRALLALHPNCDYLHYSLGLLLLSEKTDEGIGELEKAVALKPLHGPEAFTAVRRYLLSRGREEEAQVYYQKSLKISREIDDASRCWNSVASDDVYLPHKLTPEQVDELCFLLRFEKLITEAYVVAKVVPDILGGHQHILVLILAPMVNDEVAAQILDNVSRYGEAVKGFYIMLSKVTPSKLMKACKDYSDSKIYDAKTWTLPESIAVRSQTDPVLAEYMGALQNVKRENFFMRYKGNFIALGIIIVLFLLFVFSTLNAPR